MPLSKIIEFDKDRYVHKDMIYSLRKKANLTATPVTLMRATAKIIIPMDSYYNRYAWCTVIASKDKHYLCEYTCPFIKLFLREWIHENYVDFMGMLPYWDK